MNEKGSLDRTIQGPDEARVFFSRCGGLFDRTKDRIERAVAVVHSSANLTRTTAQCTSELSGFSFGAFAPWRANPSKLNLEPIVHVMYPIWKYLVVGTKREKGTRTYIKPF